MTTGIFQHPKDPDEVLDYQWDFADDLAAGESLAAHDVTVTGVTLDDSMIDGTAVRAWVSGGTAGANAEITFQATTDNTPARIFERTALLRIRER